MPQQWQLVQCRHVPFLHPFVPSSNLYGGWGFGIVLTVCANKGYEILTWYPALKKLKFIYMKFFLLHVIVWLTHMHYYRWYICTQQSVVGGVNDQSSIFSQNFKIQSFTCEHGYPGVHTVRRYSVQRTIQLNKHFSWVYDGTISSTEDATIV